MTCGRLTNVQEFEIAQSLHQNGLAVNKDEFECLRAQCLGLSIYQDTLSTVSNLSSGGAGFVFSPAIWNDSHRPLSIVHIDLEGPDWAPRLRLLSDPKKKTPIKRRPSNRLNRDGEEAFFISLVARTNYIFVDPWLGKFPRDVVMNHQIGRKAVLYPGKSLEGFLVAVGEAPIPWSYRHSYRFEVCLTVFDNLRRSHRQNFQVMVNRSPKEIESMNAIEGRGEKYIREMQRKAAIRTGSQIADAPAAEALGPIETFKEAELQKVG